jgi:hypothetical protein
VRGVSDFLGAALTRIFDILLSAFAWNAPLALWVSSVACGAALMLIFRATSRPDRIRRTRDVFLARILEMRIYQDHLALVFRAFGAALWTNCTYLRLNLLPILAILPVVMLVAIQLQARFEHAPLGSGATVTLTVALREGLDVMSTPLSLETGDGVRVDSPPVRIPARGEVSWRLRVEDAGARTVTLFSRDATYAFELRTRPGTGVVGSRRSTGAFDCLTHPGLPRLPSEAAMGSVVVGYPNAAYPWPGGGTSWLVVFIMGSFAGALLLKLLLRIEV